MVYLDHKKIIEAALAKTEKAEKIEIKSFAMKKENSNNFKVKLVA